MGAQGKSDRDSLVTNPVWGGGGAPRSTSLVKKKKKDNQGIQNMWGCVKETGTTLLRKSSFLKKGGGKSAVTKSGTQGRDFSSLCWGRLETEEEVLGQGGHAHKKKVGSTKVPTSNNACQAEKVNKLADARGAL